MSVPTREEKENTFYRLVEQMAGVKGKERRRVWIDSQTEEEIPQRNP